MRRAYALLGLAPGASAGQIRRRYRALVKTWHPDRFASDPVGQSAATERLAQINDAHRLLMEGSRLGPTPAASAAAAAPTPRQPGTRLSREELDRMVAAIGNEGPIDSLLHWFEWSRPRRPAGRLKILGAVAAGLLLAVLEFKRGHLLADLALLVTVFALVRFWGKRRSGGT